MIGVAANFDNGTFKFIADASQVPVQGTFHWRMNHWFTIFGTEYDMDVIFYKRLSHSSVFIDVAPRAE